MDDRSKILSALQATDGNIGEATKMLGASRRTIQNRMRKYGIPRGKAGRRERSLSYGKGPGVGTALLAVAAVVGLLAFLKKAPDA